METLCQEETAVEWLWENAIRDKNGLQLALSKQTNDTATEPNSTGVQIHETWLKMPAIHMKGCVSAPKSSYISIFSSTHQWAPCSWYPGPYFWEQSPRHIPPCHCLFSVIPPGWEDLFPCAQQPGYTPTTDRERAGGTNSWQTKDRTWQKYQNNPLDMLMTPSLLDLPYNEHTVTYALPDWLFFIPFICVLSLRSCHNDDYFIFQVFFNPRQNVHKVFVVGRKRIWHRLSTMGEVEWGQFRGSMGVTETIHWLKIDKLQEEELYEPERRVLSLETTLSTLNNYQGMLEWTT